MSSGSGSGSNTRQDMASDRQGSGDRGAGARSAGDRAQTRTAEATHHPEPGPMGSGVSLTTDLGNTRIGNGVVAKIAGLAARDIPGVFSMGTSMARRVGQFRSMIPGGSESVSQGVSVEVGEREAAIDLNVVTWYGQSIVEISEAVRRNVIGQIEGMTGLRVVEVNVQIDDIHVESPEDNQNSSQQQQQQQRVQ
jgi:uncharacterized alkaline shock family protein YloU